MRFFGAHKIANLMTLTLLLLFLPLGFAAEEGCDENLLKQIQELHPQGLALVEKLKAFAQEFNLPTRVLRFGPKERQVSRLLVGVDQANEAQMKAYRERFNLETPVAENQPGSLVLEFATEQAPDAYVTGALRTSADPEQPIYRWGKKDLSWNQWWKDWMLQDRKGDRAQNDDPVVGYSHIVPIQAAELANVKKFLEQPELRGKCKSDNCVAWTSSIELGVTEKESTDEQRRYLMSELGVSRSMAHFEIGRRLANAANEKHVGMVVFLNGKKGAEVFGDLAQLNTFLPPDPKIPYKNILRGIDLIDEQTKKAVAIIPDGAKIFIPIAAGASPEGVAAIIQRSLEMEKGFDLHVLVNGVSEATLKNGVKDSNGKLRLHALFLGGNLRSLYRDGLVNVVPSYLSDLNRMVRDPEQPQFHYDAILVRVSEPKQGRYSLGPNNDMIMAILRDRPEIKVIAEINANVPYVGGVNFLKKNQIHASFKSNAQLAGPPSVPFTHVEKAIGANLGSLIPDDAYIQMGIGNVFEGFVAGMAGKKNIKIFSEMFGNPLMELMKQGIAIKAETGFAYGSQELYQWLANNEKVSIVETEYVNDPGKIANLKKFHAINTALQVNLRGDVNAEIGADGQRISSPGGQVEFMSGAIRSQGGKSIIAVRSTAKNGEISAIALELYGDNVTTPDESVGYVVTEHGVAQLVGKGERERAIALINIADPKFRKQLRDQALERGIIKNEDLALIKVE